MTKFRKKPVVVDAVRLPRALFASANPVVMASAMERFEGKLKRMGAPLESWRWRGGARPGVVIPTLEGEHLASPGDWIIRGVAGEFYPCKPEVFAATYEPVGDTA